MLGRTVQPMCGRFTLTAPGADLTEHFELSETPLLQARFNIAPSQAVPAIRVASGKRELSLLKWGLVTSRSKAPSVKFSNINARAETIATSRAYRPAFENRRCLMPADGFFEWAPGPPKQPHYFRLSVSARPNHPWRPR